MTRLKVLKPFRGVLSGEVHWLPSMEVEVTDGVAEVLLKTWPDRFERVDVAAPADVVEPPRKRKK